MTDTGEHTGPRIFPSGPPISQTSGHFDYGMKNDHPQNMTDPISYWERNAVIMTADGVPEVILRVRENLRMGATQIKIAAGGGVASSFDDLDVQEFIFEEIKAAPRGGSRGRRRRARARPRSRAGHRGGAPYRRIAGSPSRARRTPPPRTYRRRRAGRGGRGRARTCGESASCPLSMQVTRPRKTPVIPMP